jgi:hypothetical protein
VSLGVTKDNHTAVLNKYADFILKQERSNRIRSKGVLKREQLPFVSTDDSAV